MRWFPLSHCSGLTLALDVQAPVTNQVRADLLDAFMNGLENIGQVSRQHAVVSLRTCSCVLAAACPLKVIALPAGSLLVALGLLLETCGL